MTKAEERKVDYIVVVVNEFARKAKLSPREAFSLLNGYGAIQLLDEEYDIEHTLPLESTVDALNAYVSRKQAMSA